MKSKIGWSKHVVYLNIELLNFYEVHTNCLDMSSMPNLYDSPRCVVNTKLPYRNSADDRTRTRPRK